MDPITPERAVELSKGDYGKESLKQVAGYAAPIFWVAADERGELSVNNGSMFFVNAGQSSHTEARCPLLRL